MSKPSRSALRPIDAAFVRPKEDIKLSGGSPLVGHPSVHFVHRADPFIASYLTKAIQHVERVIQKTKLERPLR